MAGLDKEALWGDVLDTVKISVSPAIYNTWLSHTHLSSLKKNGDRFRAEIGCNSGFVKQTIETRYFGLIQDALMDVLETPCDLAFEVKERKEKKREMAQLAPLFDDKQNHRLFIEKITRAQIRPSFTFENFAVSSGNQMAWAASDAVAREPGKSYNPLFIWGGVGVGKTHLMHAVGRRILEKNLDAKILVCTSEDFANDIVEGIRHRTTPAVRAKYRRLNALFIDDIQFIAGKDSVQEEFFHTFNTVVSAGGQIILTSDRSPDDIPRLEERLKSRFQAGLLVDVAAPDFELRCAITQIKARERGVELTNDQVNLIAANVDSARKMEGYLMRLASEAKIKEEKVTDDFIKKLFAKGGAFPQEERPRRNSEEVLDAVCRYYSIKKRALIGKARPKKITVPRQMLMYILRTEMQISLEEIGRIIGGRDHSTVIHGVDKITDLASHDESIRGDIMRIKQTVWGQA